LPISKAPYKREYRHAKGRGIETMVTCDSCGRRVPRYKTFTTRRGGMSVRGLGLQDVVDGRLVHMGFRTQRFCPACARFRKVSQPGKSERKKASRIGRTRYLNRP
jgi:small subunit ribosomal protein S26e